VEAQIRIDIHTLALTLGITCSVQTLALFVQYLTTRLKNGSGWWALGSAATSLGFIFNYFRDAPFWGPLAIVANNVLFIVSAALYLVGVARFRDHGLRRLPLALFCALAAVAILVFTFPVDDLSARRLVSSVSVAFLSAITAVFLLDRGGRRPAASQAILAAAFGVYALFFGYRSIAVILESGMTGAFFATGAFSATPSQVSMYLVVLVTSAVETLMLILMVNQRLLAESREGKDNLQTIFNTNPDASLITCLEDGAFVDANEKFTEITGYRRAELVGRTTIDLDIWGSAEQRDLFVSSLEKNGYCEDLELILMKKDGSPMTGMVSARVIQLQGKRHILSVTRDIGERKKLNQALRASEEKLKAIFSQANIGVSITDSQGRYIMFNDWWTAHLGFTGEELLKLTNLDITHPDDREASGLWFRKIVEGTVQSYRLEKRFLRKDGTFFWGDLSVSVTREEDGRVSMVIGMIVDITERKRTEERVQELVRQLEVEKEYAQIRANTDGLTMLANRRHFDDALNAEFFRLRRSGGPLSLIMLDIDHFKKFNDRYGHLSGDDCLRQVASALAGTIGRTPDLVARYGGEEFIIILPETDASGTLVIAERVRKAVEDLRIPHESSDVSRWVTVSLGLSTVWPSRLPAPVEAVEFADSALYEAKKKGRNRVSVHDANTARDSPHAHEAHVKLIWRKGDECGNETIDSQHRSLFATANSLLAAVMEGASREACALAIAGLLDEIVRHFHDEELIFSGAKYPQADEHVRIHADLVFKAKGVAAKYLREELSLGELFNFLAYDVVAQHMLLEDRKFFPYIGRQ